MKRILVAIVAVLTLLIVMVGCAGTSSGSIKSNLQGASYKVDEYTPAQYETQQQGAIETTKMTGLQSVLVAYKDVNGKTSTLIVLVFDSIENAGNVLTNDKIETTALFRFAERYADDGQTSAIGTANNVIWAGSAQAKQAAGIR